MVLRILFVPFDYFHNPRKTGPGADYMDKNSSWIRSYQQIQARKSAVMDERVPHDIWEVWYSKSPETTSKLMRGLGKDDQVYIRGHSVAGYGGIFDHANTAEDGSDASRNRDMDLYKLLDRPDSMAAHKVALKADVVAERLKKMGLQDTFNGVIKCYNCHSAEGHPNFATAMSEALTGLGYNSCGVMGYTGALSSQYDGDHKTSDTGAAETSRASKKRVVIRKAAA